MKQRPINPEELRIGNTLQYYIGEEGCEWDETTIDWQDLKWCTEKNENFNQVHKPISLSEEWLKGFGFEKAIGYIRETFDEKSLELAFNTDTAEVQWYCFYRNVNPGMNDDYVALRKNLKYVHELQNLYFALTGEELITKG